MKQPGTPAGTGGGGTIGPAGGGHTRKHSGKPTRKHQQRTAKHNPRAGTRHGGGTPRHGGGGSTGPVHVVAKPPKPRQYSPGQEVACCAAEAVGTLAGWDPDQILRLYWRTASDPDAGATIEDTIRAALDDLDGLDLGVILGVTLPQPHAIAVAPDGTWWSWGQPFNPADWPDIVIEEAWAVTL